MSVSQQEKFACFFINENSDHVLKIIKKVIGINQKALYTLKYTEQSNMFTILDEAGEFHSHFSVKYHSDNKEFELSLNIDIEAFNPYGTSIIYYSGIILDARLTYQRTQLYFCLRQVDYSLAFVIDKDGIFVSYVSEHSSFECHELVCKKFMTTAFEREISYLLDLFVNYRSLFDSYTIAELFAARNNSVAINDMKKVADMLTI
jgi:hypothetical protein